MNKEIEADSKEAILLLAHGTPDVLGEMEEYLRLVTGGHGVPSQLVHELQERYAAIGLRNQPSIAGPHLTRWTMRQADRLRARLDCPVYVGMRNWKPFIQDVVDNMRSAGIETIRAICLALRTHGPALVFSNGQLRTRSTGRSPSTSSRVGPTIPCSSVALRKS
jgi:protoporphyrin/coproporphyrin ferrochelatase